MKDSLRPIVALGALMALAGALLLASGAASAQVAVNVPVGDFYFCDSSQQGGVCTTEISVGDTVVWDFADASAPHTTSECGTSCDSPDGSLWDSGTISDGSSFQQTFTEPGTFLYRCNIHPGPMRGQIVVTAAQEPVGKPTDEPTDEPADEPTDDTSEPEPEVVAAPSTGTGPVNGDGLSPWLIAGAATAGLMMVSGGLVLAGGRRRRLDT